MSVAETLSYLQGNVQGGRFAQVIDICLEGEPQRRDGGGSGGLYSMRNLVDDPLRLVVVDLTRGADQSGILSLLGPAIAFTGLSLTALSLLSHLRMRRTVAALRKVSVSPASVDLSIAHSSLSSLEQAIASMSDEIQELSVKEKGYTNDSQHSELAQLANEMRRESRMIRLIAEDVRGNLSDSR